MNFKNLKTFEEFDEDILFSSTGDEKGDAFNIMSYKEKINFLTNKFAMSRKEAMEICDANTTFDELPEEIRDFFYD